MKKTLALILVIVLITGTLTVQNYVASASFTDDADRLFMTTIGQILDYEESEDTSMIIERETVYDIDLIPLGLVYQFSYDDKNGFMMIVSIDGILTVTETITDGVSPYTAVIGMFVYVTQLEYWYYDNYVMRFCESGDEVPEEWIEEYRDNAFFGASNLMYTDEIIYYTYRSQIAYNILSSIPDYTYGLENGCAAVAGTNIICYLDKICTNLIPNYNPGISFLSYYYYNAQNDTTKALTATLHSEMKTNTTQPGTTQNQFENGFKTYTARQGYTTSFTSIYRSVNYQSAINAVNLSDQPRGYDGARGIGYRRCDADLR